MIFLSSYGCRVNQNSKTSLYHQLREKETLGDVAKKYDTSIKHLVEFNRLEHPSDVGAGKILKVGKLPPKSSAGLLFNDGDEMIWPCHGRVTSEYGRRWGRLLAMTLRVTTTPPSSSSSSWWLLAKYSGQLFSMC